MSVVALALTLMLAVDPVGSVDPASPEGQAVLVPINATFAALAANDGNLMRPHVDTSGKITAVVMNADGTSRVGGPSWERFIDGLQPGPQRLEEIMVDPVIAIDGDIAMVWGEYIFRLDGRISHCGVDHFDLVRRDGAWKIVNLTWTQRQTGCEEIAARVGTR